MDIGGDMDIKIFTASGKIPDLDKELAKCVSAPKSSRV
jgi:hypothetical protein